MEPRRFDVFQRVDCSVKGKRKGFSAFVHARRGQSYVYKLSERTGLSRGEFSDGRCYTCNDVPFMNYAFI